MSAKDPRVDEYVAQAAGFAQPILKHIRKLVHAACPNVHETMKWSIPHFDYKGTLCSMAAFKGHCALRFWKGALVLNSGRKSAVAEESAMAHFGRLTSRADLPEDPVLIRYIKEAIRLNDSGIKAPRKTREQTTLVVPDYFRSALIKNARARAKFEEFSPSHQREYVEWVGEAKREETRQRRLETAMAWLAEGKSRNWKYEKC